MTKNEDISNPFEVAERKTLAVQNIVDKNKYLTIFFFSGHYTHGGIRYGALSSQRSHSNAYAVLSPLAATL